MKSRVEYTQVPSRSDNPAPRRTTSVYSKCCFLLILLFACTCFVFLVSFAYPIINNFLPESPGPMITIFTGTHVSSNIFEEISTQNSVCESLSEALFDLWTTTKIDTYNNVSKEIILLLDEISRDKIQCILTGVKRNSSSFSFPISQRPGFSVCNEEYEHLVNRIAKGTLHSLPEDYFLFRPNLVQLVNLAKSRCIFVRIAAIVSTEYESASFAREGGACPKFMTIIPQRIQLLIH